MKKNGKDTEKLLYNQELYGLQLLVLLFLYYVLFHFLLFLNLFLVLHNYILLSHSHYDHAGGVPYVKESWPEARVVAGEHAAAVFAKASARQKMRRHGRLKPSMAHGGGMDVTVTVTGPAGSSMGPESHHWSLRKAFPPFTTSGAKGAAFVEASTAPFPAPMT